MGLDRGFKKLFSWFVGFLETSGKKHGSGLSLTENGVAFAWLEPHFFSWSIQIWDVISCDFENWFLSRKVIVGLGSRVPLIVEKHRSQRWKDRHDLGWLSGC